MGFFFKFPYLFKCDINDDLGEVNDGFDRVYSCFFSSQLLVQDITIKYNI